MKITKLLKKFNKEFSRDGSTDYVRARAWLEQVGVNPNLKVPAKVAGKEQGIVPYLVHSVERTEYSTEVEWD